ncbi:MAG TPA: DUF4912 domain-containing protein [Anaeromyxobacteraceae bacterium]|nr:DUF4912 domain-containing protein [Anaeromyxobacteraceae bacterium]
MADLRKLSLEALRELAKKSLGQEHSRYKTKAELIEALTAVKARVASAADEVGQKLAPGGRRRLRSKPSGEKGSSGEGGQGGGRAAGASLENPLRASPAVDREPDPEGHMVARVAGEEAARVAPHPLTESALDTPHHTRRGLKVQGPGIAPFDERLGELPPSYDEDTLVVLPRDPWTLFVYWDHAGTTLSAAMEGLAEARSELWIFACERTFSWARQRVVPFALASKSYYVHDLLPGRLYLAEIHLVDSRGEERLLHPRSNVVLLPGLGPSAVDDRFLRILWDEPLPGVGREAYAGQPFPEEMRGELAHLSDWSRFGRIRGGSGAGGMGGRPSSPGGLPASPPDGPAGKGR